MSPDRTLLRTATAGRAPDRGRRAWLAAALLAGSLAGLPARAAEERRIEWPASVELLDGRRLSAAELASRPVVVVYWSATCGYCQRHNRHVEKLHQAAKGTDLLVLGVSTDPGPDVAREHARHEGYGFANTMESALPGALFERRRFIPRTYLVERGGRLAKSYPGEMFEADVMEFLRWSRPLAPGGR